MTHLSEHKFPSETAILWLSYFLLILLITAPIGALISTMKSRQYKRLINQSGASDNAEYAFLESHHQWLVRTFIGAVIMAMMALGTLYYFFGYLIAIAAIAWWIYRLGNGIGRLITHRTVRLAV